MKAKFAKLVITPETSSTRTGNVLHFSAKGGNGETLGGEILWAVEGSGAQVWPDGAFVAERPGMYTVVAVAGDREASASVLATPRNVGREVEFVSRSMPQDEQFAEEWIWDHYAYLSGISDKVFVYDIADPAHPVNADPLKVDARIINDVSVTTGRKNRGDHARRCVEPQKWDRVSGYERPDASESIVGIHGDRYGRRTQRVCLWALRIP